MSASAEESVNVLHSLRLSRMILPISIGLLAVAYLFYRQFDLEQFRSIEWTTRAFVWIGIGAVLMVVRHFFYALRMRVVTGHAFSWRKCLELIVIWEFSAALTPTSKGGPIVMLFVLTQEKLAAGRTAAAVFYTMVCDAGFFIILLPILLSIYGPPMLYPGMESYSDARVASGAFFVTYSIMLVYWLTLVFFLFIRPNWIKAAIGWVSRRRFLQRWGPKLARLGEEFGLAASEIRQQNFRYHLGVLGGTLGAWTCKFAMINCLMIAIAPNIPVDGQTQAFIYARLVAMFTIMAFSPTPGGAGLAEMALVGFIADYVPKGIGLVVALLWRGMAYYGYLLLGAVVVPNWIARRGR